MPKQHIISKSERLANAINFANRETESLIAKYLAANPKLKVEDCVLVQQHHPNGTIHMWVEPRKVPVLELSTADIIRQSEVRRNPVWRLFGIKKA